MTRLTLLLAVFVLVQQLTFSQERSGSLRMRTAVFSEKQNIQAAGISPELRNRMQYRNRNYVLLRFSELPAVQRKLELQKKGVKLFDYIPGNGYFAELPADLELRELKAFAVNGVFFTDETVKISPALYHKTLGPDEFVAVHYAADLSKTEVLQQLQATGARFNNYPVQPNNTIFVKADTTAIRRIARLPFVTYVYAQALKDIPLNYISRSSNNISSLADPSGRNLQGRGVTLGIGDNGDPTHLDFTGRLVNNNPVNNASHGVHTQGTMAGAGLLNPKYKGMAPKASIVAELYSDILVRTPDHISKYGMVLTNNSYHSSTPGCDGTGTYDALSNFVDAQLVNNPSLLHVFASGNDGQSTCGLFPYSYATVRAGFQSSKNALVVGQYNNSNDLIGPGSSRGPVKDGRLKPEIMAGGINVMSPAINNSYGIISGTSMSAPAVTGSLALLYERYRQLHSGANPSGALIKALACNGADDMGNPGPDYLWGFGKLNARTSIEMMEQQQYFTGSVANGASSTHTIPELPAGASQLKVLLYWVDPPASPVATTALVNDLDLTVTGTDAVTHRPLILNPHPAHVTETAVEGTDNLNNIEQVVISNPPAGNVNITIAGTNVPAGPQQYVVVYQVLQPVVYVDYPAGGETMVPGETEQIRWSAYDNSSNTFTIEYSPDNGASWSIIDNNVAANVRFYHWTAPTVASRQALVRVSRNGGGPTATSTRSFTVLGQPLIVLTNPCPQYIQVSWDPVVDADSYEILQLAGDSMQVVGTTNANTYLLEGLLKDSTYWIAVRALINGVPGRPSVAASLSPSGGSCGAFFNNDLIIDSILRPANGREFTTSQPAAQPLQIRVRNRGAIDINSTNYELGYQINGGSPMTINNGTSITAGGYIDFSFAPVINFDVPDDYLIKAWVKLPGDPFEKNDTLQMLIRHLPNPPITLSPSFTEGFESASIQTYLKKTFGLEGLPRADFAANSTNGRARIAADGFARSGNHALLLDQVRYRTPANTDSVTLTFNLSAYNATDQIWLDFFYRNQGINISYPNNKVWIRGNDQAAWLPVFTIPPDVSEIGVFKAAPAVNITEILANAVPVQSVSSSFQVRLGQESLTSFHSPTPQNGFEDGITYDDIKLTLTSTDVGVRTIINPSLSSICQLGAAEPIRVEVKNYGNTPQTNVEVAYELNGTVVKEFIDLDPNEELIHQFTTPVDLSAFQQYTIRAWVHMSGDDYVNNDSLPSFTFNTAPEINTFPYLESFENNNGYWFTTGANSSWEHGTPNKPIITRAANGNKAWVTGLTGPYNSLEYSYLYSPCINLNGMTQPYISFSHIYRMEEGCDCDHHWIEYSTDDKTWTKMTSFGSTNWYNHSGFGTWFYPMPYWHVSSTRLPVFNGRIRLRFVVKTDAGSNHEGVGIDDIHIYDKAAVYTGADIPAGVVRPVSGNTWTHFAVSNTRIVSINPQGQDLGSTTVKLFRNTGPIRNNSQQYYLDRNIVITPSTAPTSNVLVRFYFTDVEAKALMNASNCAGCTKPADAYLAGITQYSGNASEENGTLADNTAGNYQFIPPSQVTIVPYDNGYYAEYAVSHFSEFWINGGGPGQNAPLPVTLSSFTATRRNNTGLLHWQTSQEMNSKTFTIEKSTDGALFIPIGTVPAAGNSQTPLNYQFTDPLLSKGTNHYRLLMTDIDGRSERSVIRSIQSDDAGLHIQVYPNPVVNSVLFIRSSEEVRRIELTDISGRILLQRNTTGFQHTLNLQQFARGTYLLSLYTGGSKKTQRIVLGE